MSERNYYVVCEDNCKFPAITREQTLAAIQQAVTSGTITGIENAVVSKIKEMNHGGNLSFWVGTQAEYNALASTENGVIYIISDDTQKEDVIAAVDALQVKVGELQTNANAVSQSVTALEGRMTTAEGDIDQAQDDIDDAVDDITAAQSSVQTMQGTVNTLSSNVTALSQKAAGNPNVTLNSGGGNLEEMPYSLSQNYSGFSKIIVVTSVAGCQNTSVIYPAIVGTNSMTFRVCGGNYENYFVCKLGYSPVPSIGYNLTIISLVETSQTNLVGIYGII